MVSWKLPWRTGSGNSAALRIDDPSLRIVAEGADETVPSSAALASCGFDEVAPVVLRHLLQLPPVEVDAVMARLAADGYVRDPAAESDGAEDGSISVTIARVLPVDAVVLSRERARMSSMMSRAGGRVTGWAVLRVPDTR
ncbi:hypothetical protein [Gordonia neofelifaecis]|uniref:Uncharacterized protein n=1 Tax=Gordonia neofelifaecis NRRL B-59395 TaxID=644548 RepID=F1YHI2_9ACTN|nr:hypothetical protein [Gordonia neofelifaecis]EGD55820.1 hypothetical protein SCNU_06250 [Gordonia neofelifaecis NRRL B-59395]